MVFSFKRHSVVYTSADGMESLASGPAVACLKRRHTRGVPTAERDACARLSPSTGHPRAPRGPAPVGALPSGGASTALNLAPDSKACKGSSRQPAAAPGLPSAPPYAPSPVPLLPSSAAPPRCEGSGVSSCYGTGGAARLSALAAARCGVRQQARGAAWSPAERAAGRR